MTQFLICTFTIIIFSSVWGKTAEITFACNNFPPLKIENNKGDYPGSDIEILRESFKKSNIEINTKFYPWNRALRMATLGQVAGLCSCSYTKSREKHFFFSKEIGSNSIGFFTKKDFQITDLKDFSQFKGREVGVVRGYNLEDELKKKKVKVNLNSNELNILKMLKIGRVKALYSYKAVVSELMKKNEFIKEFKYTEVRRSPYYTCFSKAFLGSKENLVLFNKGLEIIRKNGEYGKILRKYGLK